MLVWGTKGLCNEVKVQNKRRNVSKIMHGGGEQGHFHTLQSTALPSSFLLFFQTLIKTLITSHPKEGKLKEDPENK